MKIELKEEGDTVLVMVNDIVYAVFQDCMKHWIDELKVINWVKGTCSEGCYLSEAYIPPNLRLDVYRYNGSTIYDRPFKI